MTALIWHKGRHPWDEHDGYPRHQHSLNGVLTIAPGDTRPHFAHGPAFEQPPAGPRLPAVPEVTEEVRSAGWQLHYSATVGPDSWQGGYDTPEAAREALEYQRAREHQLPDSHPERWTATRTTVLVRTEDEAW